MLSPILLGPNLPGGDRLEQPSRSGFGATRKCCWKGLGTCDPIRLLALIDAANAADDPAQGENIFVVGGKDLAHAAAPVIPALQDGNMFHHLDSAFDGRRWNRRHRILYPRFHRWRLASWHNLLFEGEWRRVGNPAAIDAK